MTNYQRLGGFKDGRILSLRVLGDKVEIKVARFSVSSGLLLDVWVSPCCVFMQGAHSHGAPFIKTLIAPTNVQDPFAI